MRVKEAEELKISQEPEPTPIIPFLITVGMIGFIAFVIAKKPFG